SPTLRYVSDLNYIAVYAIIAVVSVVGFAYLADRQIAKSNTGNNKSIPLREIPQGIAKNIAAVGGPIEMEANTKTRWVLDHAGEGNGLCRELMQVLPIAIYMTDTAGCITFYNEAAAALWGCRPKLGDSKFCGSWKLYWPDGTPLPHDECPMSMAL